MRAEQVTESGRPHDIWRCPDCLTAMWSDYGRREVMVFLRVMTLDRSETCPPDVHIYTRSKLDFVRLPPGARSFEEYYDIEQVWPPGSLARRVALGCR